MSVKPVLFYSDEVANALKLGLPVVALESTIISHGMPFPQNIATAKEVEQEIRNRGAIPATIAIIDGRVCLGCNDKELEILGSSGDVLKLSRRDLPLAISKKMNGATTVAATLIIAAWAGIKVFATGGIGGVHREADQSFDISADLAELAMTDVAVVCAGVKAILDIPKTLELLETFGVPVLTFQADEFPAFYSRSSGIKAEVRMNSPEEIADFIQVKVSFGLKGGVLIANPIPEAFDFPAVQMNKAIASANEKMKKEGVAGKLVTPFLLKEISAITEGRSLVSNIELIKNNARLAADISRILASQVIGQ